MTHNFTPWLDHLPARATPARNTRNRQWFQYIFVWCEQHGYTLTESEAQGIEEGHQLLFTNGGSSIQVGLHLPFTIFGCLPGVVVIDSTEAWCCSLSYRSPITLLTFLLNSLEHNPDND